MSRNLKIFISSPGDVIPERELARKVIAELNEEMMGKVFLVPVLWENEPLLASGTFQTQIDSPEETQILLGILWSRIGSPLPDSILRPDGSRYDSGTAYEFETALASHQKKGKPDILLYRKLGAPSVSLDDRKELAERLEQMDRLDSYVKKQLMSEDGSYLAAFHTFETEEKFEEILKTHLRKLILKQLEEPEKTEEVESKASQDDIQEVSEAPPQLADALSVAVLPFDNMSKDPEQEFFVDGLTEDIITELSRFKDLDVIARNSTFQYKGKSVDVREVAQELGVRYVLEGSVRKSGNALRVTGQLLDAADGSHLWAETYDRNLSDVSIFDVQDELSKGIASVIGDLWGVLGQMRQSRVVRGATENLDSNESVAYGNAYFRTGSEEEHFRAREIIEKAIERDPDNGDVWAQSANLYMAEHASSHNPLPNSLDRCLKAAQRAVELNPGSDRTYASLATAHFYRNEMRAFRAAAEHVLKIAPSSGMRTTQMGSFYYRSGDHKRGMELVSKGINAMMQITSSPVPGFLRVTYFVDHYRNDRYEEALDEVSKMDMPKFWAAQAFMAAASAMLGADEEMEIAKTRLLDLWPEFAAMAKGALQNLDGEDVVVDQLLEGLRKSGIEIQDD